MTPVPVLLAEVVVNVGAVETTLAIVEPGVTTPPETVTCIPEAKLPMPEEIGKNMVLAAVAMVAVVAVTVVPALIFN